ncbi:MAG: Cyclic nucleotide-regulated FAD-dependent pyridine nucleotide-disulfide oxidoreductase, partial [Ramlibacter sp.]|nr:Cyclic nucleotide-regulated FAD-dependent pyridine nucleotide-disulfide oxidoreductase [Ramlibacter sp.]
MNEAAASAGPPSIIEARRAQVFLTLSEEEVARVHRFGRVRRFADGEWVFKSGRASPGVYLVLSGAIRISGHDALGQQIAVTEHGAGGFAGELAQLSERPSFVDGLAAGPTDTLEINTSQLHALLVAEAALGEKLMRAMILRRVALIEGATGGPTLIGVEDAPDIARLRSFLSRNGVPHQLLDPSVDSDAQAFVAGYAPEQPQVPLVICPDGAVLRNPGERELAQCIGMLDLDAANALYDVAIVGAGPA